MDRGVRPRKGGGSMTSSMGIVMRFNWRALQSNLSSDSLALQLGNMIDSDERHF